MKLRSMIERVSNDEKIPPCDELLPPPFLACETKKEALVAIAVGCIQRLLSHDLLTSAALPAVVKVYW